MSKLNAKTPDQQDKEARLALTMAGRLNLETVFKKLDMVNVERLAHEALRHQRTWDSQSSLLATVEATLIELQRLGLLGQGVPHE